MFINSLMSAANKSAYKVIKDQKKKQQKQTQQLIEYEQSSFDGYLSGAPGITSFVTEIAPGRMCNVGNLEKFEYLEFKNITRIKADCGAVIYKEDETVPRDKRPVIVFDQPLEIDQDAFEMSSNVIYEFRGGISKMAESVFWDSKNVIIRIAGDIPPGKPWTDGKGKNVIVEQILPDESA